MLDVGPCQDQFTGPGIAEGELPLLLALHGGGGNKQAAERTTCSEGEVGDESCLHRHAQDNGYAVLFPNGTGFGLLPDLRTWNAGGGDEEWRRWTSGPSGSAATVAPSKRRSPTPSRTAPGAPRLGQRADL